MYAIIDIGSNTIRMVLYKVIDNEIQQMLNSKIPAGLAGYIDNNNMLSKKGILKAIEALSKFETILESVDVKEVHAFATASLRNISNSEEVLAEIKKHCSFDIEIISGKEEALYDYYGTMKSISSGNGLLVDVGGGSTELVYFENGTLLSTCSIPVGSLNMYTNYVEDIIPTKSEIKNINNHVSEILNTLPLSSETINSTVLFGVGGSARACCKLSDELFNENSGYTGFECKRLNKILKLTKKDKSKLVSAIIKATPGRIHTIIPGIAIINSVAKHYGCTNFTVSPYGVREGYLLNILESKNL